jgi:exosortase/archaeosortase family protein
VVPSGHADSREPRRGLVHRLRGKAEIRFVLSFVLIAGVLFSLYSFPYPEGSRAQHASDVYLAAYAHLAGWVLSLVEPHLVVTGQNIAGGRYALRIIRGCDAVDAQILFVAAVFASHVHSFRARLAGAAIGSTLITVANVVRICALYYVGALVPAYFDFFHHEFWPIVLVVVAAGTFLGWARIASSRGGAEGVAA